MNAKEISLTAMLGAISAVARVPFAAIPSVQPSTFIIASSGYVFGAARGFAVGALTAIVSGFFLGIGPWTLFQILAWGLCGAFFSVLGRLHLPVWVLAVFGFLWGYIFGFIMNLWFLLAFGFPLTLKAVVSLQVVSFWMDTLHGAGNAAFFLMFGRRVTGILKRFKQRFFLETNVKINP
jgi:energy-coupling factor transport system substrate-specific component